MRPRLAVFATLSSLLFFSWACYFAYYEQWIPTAVALLLCLLPWLMPALAERLVMRAWLKAATQYCIEHDFGLGWVFEHQEPALLGSELAELRCGPLVFLSSSEPSAEALEKVERVVSLCHDTFRRRRLYISRPIRIFWMILPGPPDPAGERMLGNPWRWWSLPKEGKAAALAIVYPPIQRVFRRVQIAILAIFILALIISVGGIFDFDRSAILPLLGLGYAAIVFSIQLRQSLAVLSAKSQRLALVQRLRSAAPEDSQGLRVRAVY